MTKQEKDEFIAKVKGKKIRWSEWRDEGNSLSYFIPDGYQIKIKSYQAFSGLYFDQDGDNSDQIWNIQEGFSQNTNGDCWEFVEEPKLKIFKVKVDNSKETTQLQEHLFKLGYDWSSPKNEKKNQIQHANQKYFYGYDNKEITFGSDEHTFNGHFHPLYSLSEILSWETSEKTEKVDKRKCICTHNLFHFGCKCGGFQAEMKEA